MIIDVVVDGVKEDEEEDEVDREIQMSRMSNESNRCKTSSVEHQQVNDKHELISRTHPVLFGLFQLNSVPLFDHGLFIWIFLSGATSMPDKQRISRSSNLFVLSFMKSNVLLGLSCYGVCRLVR